jgi:uncharacterized membrane protein YeaQ/YmgE (transglycosylase-associated protein family)
MFYILGWLIFGAVVGFVAKMLHPGDEKLSFFQTIGLGIAGSFLGGFINLLFGGSFGSAGLFMSIVGAILLCVGWSYKDQILGLFSKK